MKIVTDCAADMPVNELNALNVTQAPLYIQFPNGEINSADISPDEFYNRLEAMQPKIPTTAQPSSGVFRDIYSDLSKQDDQILSIHISSGLSGTLNSATQASKLVSPDIKVTVWDSMTLSGGERFQVLFSAWAAKANWQLDAIKNRLEQIREKTEVIYTLETLEYLSRGGRIGRVQALAGSLLKIKPIIHVDHKDGKYSTVSRARTIPQALDLITEHLRDLYNEVPLWVTVLHGRFLDSAKILSQQLNQRLNINKTEILRISPVLGVHTGPGIIGVAAVPMRLMDEVLD